MFQDKEVNKTWLLSGKAMKELDYYTIDECGVSSLDLMERAAFLVYEQFKKDQKRENLSGRILILAGKGNNGADGLALARLMKEDNPKLEVYVGLCAAASPKIKIPNANTTSKLVIQKNSVQQNNINKAGTTDQWKIQFQRLPNDLLVINRDQILSMLQGDSVDFAFDSMIGIGLKSDLRQDLQEIVEALNQWRMVHKDTSKPIVYSLDVPTGIDADNGVLRGQTAVRSDITVTFGYKKIGLVMNPGCIYAGQVITATKMGFAAEGLAHLTEPVAYTYEQDALLPKRMDYSNKGSYGKLLIIAGSVNMAGAAYFSAAAAYASGTGLVKVFTPEENRQVIQTLVPEAILTTYSNDQNQTLHLLRQAMEWADTAIIGPGLGMGFISCAIVEYFLQNRKKMTTVIDADALNILALSEEKGLWDYIGPNDILTPHLGELARLLGVNVKQICTDITGYGYRLYHKSHGAVCVCKDSKTLVISNDESKPYYINTSGNNGMASAGMGDVLTGIIGGFAAQKMSPTECAENGVYLHGRIGDAGSETYSPYALTASKMIQVYQEILSAYNI